MNCECAEEQERREEEKREKERLRNLLMREQGGSARDGSGMWDPRQGSCCDDAESCSFFTGGVGSGGGSWMPLAGSAFLLALLAYLFKYISKALLRKGKLEGTRVGRILELLSKDSDKDTSVVTKSESKPKPCCPFECPVKM